MNDEEQYMRAALEQARQAGTCDEVPVGAVVVQFAGAPNAFAAL